MKDTIKAVLRGMKRFGEYVAILVNTILLFITYFLGVGITWLIAKAMRKEVLQKKLGAASYWTPLELKTKPKDEYLKQF